MVPYLMVCAPLSLFRSNLKEILPGYSLLQIPNTADLHWYKISFVNPVYNVNKNCQFCITRVSEKVSKLVNLCTPKCY